MLESSVGEDCSVDANGIRSFERAPSRTHGEGDVRLEVDLPEGAGGGLEERIGGGGVTAIPLEPPVDNMVPFLVLDRLVLTTQQCIHSLIRKRAADASFLNENCIPFTKM